MEREGDNSSIGRARQVLAGVVPTPVFVATMLITTTVFTLETIQGWQALAASGVTGSIPWLLYQAATYDKLATTAGAALLSVVGGNYARFLVEAFMLFYDRVRKFDQVRAEAEAKGRARGLDEGVVLGVAQGRAEAVAELNQKVQGWVARRDAAAKRGLPFDEPPPLLD